jgi:zinc and cadmium transporter
VAVEACGPVAFGWWISLAVVGLFCIERFIAPHSHEIGGHGHCETTPGHLHDHAHEGEASPEHPPVGVPPGEMRAAAPAVAGWMAVLGLTIHTFMNGVGLAGSVKHDIGTGSMDGLYLGSWVLIIPGLAMFLAIFLHKPADALAISMVLSRKGVGRGKLFLVQVGFAAMIPVGVVAFYLTAGEIKEDLESQLTGAALAFSAGTFIFIALSDLLPELQFHHHDRVPLFLTLIAGVALMGGIALLEGHEHGHGGHAHSDHGGARHKDHDHDGDHDHDHKKSPKHDHDDDHDHDHDHKKEKRHDHD